MLPEEGTGSVPIREEHDDPFERRGECVLFALHRCAERNNRVGDRGGGAGRRVCRTGPPGLRRPLPFPGRQKRSGRRSGLPRKKSRSVCLSATLTRQSRFAALPVLDPGSPSAVASLARERGWRTTGGVVGRGSGCGETRRRGPAIPARPPRHPSSGARPTGRPGRVAPAMIASQVLPCARRNSIEGPSGLP